jgi:hypothetical protein
MSIRATCSNCGKTTKGGDDWAGKSAKCPACGAVIHFTVDIYRDDAPPVMAPKPTTDPLNWLEPPTDLLPPPPEVPVSSPNVPRCPAQPTFDTSTGGVLCLILGILVFLGALVVLIGAASAIHEILSGVGVIVSVLLLVMAVLFSINASIKNAANHAADLARQNAADQIAMMSQLKGELVWQRQRKEEEILREKAAAREGASP